MLKRFMPHWNSIKVLIYYVNCGWLGSKKQSHVFNESFFNQIMSHESFCLREHKKKSLFALKLSSRVSERDDNNDDMM